MNTGPADENRDDRLRTSPEDQVVFSVVLVAYNSADVIRDAIESVPAPHEVIVVDNASTDASREIAAAAGARVLALAENLGFGTACNRGAAQARNDTLLFLNPDARLMPGALDALAAGMARYPASAAFSPRVVKSNGQQYYRARNRLIGDRFRLDGPPQADMLIPMAVGAALAFRKPVFDALSGFDENIFLYFEDVDLSARTILAGHGIHHIHDAVVVHSEGASTPSSPRIIDFKAYHFMKANLYVCRKFGISYNRPWHIVSNWGKLIAARLRGDTDAEITARARLRALMER